MNFLYKTGVPIDLPSLPMYPGYAGYKGDSYGEDIYDVSKINDTKCFIWKLYN